MELSKKEIEAFEGLNQSYADMEDDLNKRAPHCHFRPMFLDGPYGDAWWECSHCGHTKAV